MGGACSKHGRDKKYKSYVAKSEGMRPLGRPKCRWEDNIRMDVTKIVWQDVISIYTARERDQRRALVNTLMNLQVP
jgi:hypothetical protein